MADLLAYDYHKYVLVAGLQMKIKSNSPVFRMINLHMLLTRGLSLVCWYAILHVHVLVSTMAVLLASGKSQVCSEVFGIYIYNYVPWKRWLCPQLTGKKNNNFSFFLIARRNKHLRECLKLSLLIGS